MRRTLLLFILLAAAVVRIGATEAYTVKTVPNIHLQDARQYVSDPAALLTPAARDTINAILNALEDSTGIETAVIMLPSIGGDDPFQFGVELFRSWGIGKKKSDNGLLILYVEDQHKIRFITGYGIEGTLTDALCKRIQTRYMVPAFRQGDRDGGMVAGCKAVALTLDGSMKPDSEEDNGGGWMALTLLAVILIGMAFLLLHRRKQTCPQCGQKAMVLTSTDYFRLNGIRYRKEIYTCEKCGKVVVKNIPDDDTPRGNGLAEGMIIGSMLGGGRSGGGGGFSGGSFGGGSTGGGGAGSDW